MTWAAEFSLQWSLRTWMFCLFEKSTFLNLLCFFQICFLFPFICVYVFPACVFMYHTHAWRLCWAEQGIRSLGTGIRDSCERRSRYWEWKPGPMAEQPLGFSSSPEDLFPFYFMCMGILFACIPVQHMHAVPLAAERRCWILLNWNDRWLLNISAFCA